MIDVMFRFWSLGIRTTECCSGHLWQQGSQPYITMECDDLSFAVTSMMHHVNNDRVNIMVNEEKKLICIAGMNVPQGDVCAQLKAQYEFFQLVYEVLREIALHEEATGTEG